MDPRRCGTLPVDEDGGQGGAVEVAVMPKGGSSVTPTATDVGSSTDAVEEIKSPDLGEEWRGEDRRTSGTDARDDRRGDSRLEAVRGKEDGDPDGGVDDEATGDEVEKDEEDAVAEVGDEDGREVDELEGSTVPCCPWGEELTEDGDDSPSED